LRGGATADTDIRSRFPFSQQVYAGKKDEAKAQFARAGQLDLTPSENAEMAGVTHG